MLCWRIRVWEEEKSPPESKHPTKFPVQARKRARERKRAWNIGRQKEDNLLWHFRVNTTCVRTVLHRCDFTGGDLHYYSWTKSTSTSTVCRVRDICSNTVLYSMLRFVCFLSYKSWSDPACRCECEKTTHYTVRHQQISTFFLLPTCISCFAYLTQLVFESSSMCDVYIKV